MPTNIKPQNVELKLNKSKNKVEVKRTDIKNKKGSDLIKDMSPAEYQQHLDSAVVQNPSNIIQDVKDIASLTWDTAQLLDPTGVTSIPSTVSAWGDGEFTYQDITEPLGLLPLLIGKRAGIKGNMVRPNTGAIGTMANLTNTSGDVADLVQDLRFLTTEGKRDMIKQDLRSVDNELENGGELHPFIKMAGLKTEKEFLKKYKSEDEFFSAFPQARNGYTLNDPNNPYQPIGGTLDYNGVQPMQLPQNARGNDVIRYQSDNIQNYQPSMYQQNQQTTGSGNTGAAQTSNWIGQAANIATNVVDGIGSFWKNVQVAAPQLLNALIPDNEPRRVNRPLIADNQYAYGTGSQMMYENGGNMYEKGKDYTLSQQQVQQLKDMGYEIEIY